MSFGEDISCFFTIENNGNILTDGTDERKYLQKKYDKLQFHLITENISS